MVTGEVRDRVFQGENYRVALQISASLPYFNIQLADPVDIGEVITVGFRARDVLCLANESRAV
jgi:hypothetical protein